MPVPPLLAALVEFLPEGATVEDLLTDPAVLAEAARNYSRACTEQYRRRFVRPAGAVQ
jgi:hypothetical protein